MRIPDREEQKEIFRDLAAFLVMVATILAFAVLLLMISEMGP